MTALAEAYSLNTTKTLPTASIPASVEVMTAILEHYGFDFFFERTLRMINLDNTDYADAVDDAIEHFHSDDDLNSFSLRRAFRAIVEDLKEDEGFTYEESLEFLAEEDYVVPVTTALAYSVDAGETDIEYLSKLIRNRAKRLLRQLRRARPQT